MNIYSAKPDPEGGKKYQIFLGSEISTGIQGRKVGPINNSSTIGAKITSLFSFFIEAETDTGFYYFEVSKNKRQELEGAKNQYLQEKDRKEKQGLKTVKILLEDQKNIHQFTLPLKTSVDYLDQLLELDPKDVNQEGKNSMDLIYEEIEEMKTKLQDVKTLQLQGIYQTLQNFEKFQDKKALKALIQNLQSEIEKLERQVRLASSKKPKKMEQQESFHEEGKYDESFYEKMIIAITKLKKQYLKHKPTENERKEIKNLFNTTDPNDFKNLKNLIDGFYEADPENFLKNLEEEEQKLRKILHDE